MLRSGSRASHDGRGTTRGDAIDRLVGERVRGRVLGAWHVIGRPAIERAERPSSLFPQRDQLCVLDPPAAGQLLDDQLRVEEHRDLAGTELLGEGERPHDSRVFGDVVRLDAEEVGDRGVSRRERVAGVGPRGVDQDGARRCGPGVAASRAVGADDEPALPRGRRCGLVAPERRASRAVVGGVQAGPLSAGAAAASLASPSLPRSFRQNHRTGS